MNIHADFNRYARYDMHRRVNVFIYLNPNWTESYGGHLELWSKDLLRCEQKVSSTQYNYCYHNHYSTKYCTTTTTAASLVLVLLLLLLLLLPLLLLLLLL